MQECFNVNWRQLLFFSLILMKEHSDLVILQTLLQIVSLNIFINSQQDRRTCLLMMI